MVAGAERKDPPLAKGAPKAEAEDPCLAEALRESGRSLSTSPEIVGESLDDKMQEDLIDRYL